MDVVPEDMKLVDVKQEDEGRRRSVIGCRDPCREKQEEEEEEKKKSYDVIIQPK